MSQTVYFTNPVVIDNLINNDANFSTQISSMSGSIATLNATTATQSTQISSMSGSIATLNTTTAAQSTLISQMSGSITSAGSSQIGFTYAYPSIGQSDAPVEIEPFDLIAMYDKLKYGYLMNTGSTMLYTVPEGYPLEITIKFDDTGISYKSVSPSQLTSADDLLYIWSGIIKIIWLVMFGQGNPLFSNNQFSTKRIYFDNEEYGRNYFRSLGVIVKGYSTELANGTFGVLSFNGNATSQILSNYGDAFINIAADRTIWPYGTHGAAGNNQFAMAFPLKWWEPRYYTTSYLSGLLNFHAVTSTASTVNASLSGTSQAFRPAASVLKGLPYVFSTKIRQIAYFLKESNRILRDIPEIGIPPVREGSAGTSAPYTGAFGQAYVNGTGPSTNLIARLRGTPDEDGNAMFSSLVWPSSSITMTDRPSYQTYLTYFTGSIASNYYNYRTTTGNTSFDPLVLNAMIDGSYELTSTEKTDLKNKLAAIYNQEMLPLIQQLYNNYNYMVTTNGRSFYDDNFPSYWRSEIPGLIQYMTGAGSSITYKYDITQPGNLGTGAAWTGMIVNMTGVSAATISKLITESTGTMYAITGSTGTYYVPINHSRISKYSEHYSRSLAHITASFQGNVLPLLYKEDTNIQYYQYTGYNQILQNYASTGVVVNNITQLEDIMTQIGISQLSFYNDLTYFTANNWINATGSIGYTGFGGATGVSSLANLPSYTGFGTTWTNALGATPTFPEQVAWVNGYSNYLTRANTLSDIDVLGYNYGWTGSAASMFVMTGAGFTAPSDATLAAQRGTGNRALYSPALPFDYIYRQHFPVRASDGTPVTTSGGSTPIASLPFSLQSRPVAVTSIWTSAQSATYSSTGYYNPNVTSFVGTFYGYKYQYFIDRMANWLFNNLNSTYFSQGYINRYLLTDTPSGTGSTYMATGPYGRINKHLRFGINEISSGNNTVSIINNLDSQQIYNVRLTTATLTPGSYNGSPYNQLTAIHEAILGHGMQSYIKAADAYLGNTPVYNWIANLAVASTTRTAGNTLFTLGTAVISEGWATWAELVPLTIGGEVFSLTKTGELGEIDYPNLIISLNNTSRNSARFMVDVACNSPRYGWSFGKTVNQYYNLIGAQISQSFTYRYYTQQANQTTYGIGLNINVACVSILYNLLGDDFDNSLFFNQRMVFSEITGSFLISYVIANKDYYRKSLATSSPFYIAP
jgi:hypothetical protein